MNDTFFEIEDLIERLQDELSSGTETDGTETKYVVVRNN